MFAEKENARVKQPETPKSETPPQSETAAKTDPLPQQSKTDSEQALPGSENSSSNCTVTIPSNIRGVSTPTEMVSNRIPPRVDTPVEVQVSGMKEKDKAVTFKIENSNESAGTALINGEKKLQMSTNGTIALNLKGQSQTMPGSSGQLKLSAFQGRKKVAESSGFSVSSIPQDWKCAYFRDASVEYPDEIGFAVSDDFSSDSTVKNDLSQVMLSESIVPKTRSGILKNVNDINTGYQKALKEHGVPSYDTHSIGPVANITKEGYSLQEQLTIFWDKRTGEKDIPVRNSGFKIEMDLKKNPDVAGKIKLDIHKYGAAVIVNGISTGAGEGNIQKEYST